MNKIHTFAHWGKKQPQKLLAFCYAGVAAVIILSALLTTAFNVIAHKSGFYQQKSLNIHDFEHVGVEVVDDMTMINATNDTQLIYEGNVKNVYIKCDFSATPGEFVAFYSRKNDYAFGIHQMVYARQEGDYYVFRFPAGTKQVRIDTGVEPSITVEFEEITLNRYSLREVTGIGTGHAFYMMICPLLVFSLLYTSFALVEIIEEKRTKNKHITA